jgi:hypothetical protein
MVGVITFLSPFSKRSDGRRASLSLRGSADSIDRRIFRISGQRQRKRLLDLGSIFVRPFGNWGVTIGHVDGGGQLGVDGVGFGQDLV